MTGRLLIIIGLGLGLSTVQPRGVGAYFTASSISPELMVKAGDWQAPALSFWLVKPNQAKYQLKEEITDTDLVQSGQALPASAHPRWLGFRYRLTSDSTLCGAQFVPVQLFFDQKLVWYVVFTPCQELHQRWQTAVVNLPQSAGQLHFQLSTPADIAVNFDLDQVTTLAVGLTHHDRVEIEVDESIPAPVPTGLHYTQDGYQITSHQVTDWAGKTSPTYQLFTLWQSTPPQLDLASTIYRDNPDQFSLILTSATADCIDLVSDQVLSLAPVIPWLNWSDSQPLICGPAPVVPLTLTAPPTTDQLKIIMTNTAGLQSDMLWPLATPLPLPTATPTLPPVTPTL